MHKCILLIATFLLAAAPATAAGQKPQNFAARQKPYFSLMKVEEVWKITRGGPGCTIGIIDSGFDFFHPALQANLKPGWFAPGFYHTDFFTMVDHGTLVASIIAGRQTPKDDGMWGMAPGCTVIAASQGMPIHELALMERRYLTKNPKATFAGLQKYLAAHSGEAEAFGKEWLAYVSETDAGAIHYLVDHGARVINISEFLSTALMRKTDPQAVALLQAAFSYAKSKDVLIVLGAGNNNQRVLAYPGDPSFVLVVGASTLAGKRWTMTTKVYGREITQGSDYGPRLSVVAPVENIVVAAAHEQAYYNWKDTPMGPQKIPYEGPYQVLPWGATSCAAPQAAALAALVRTIRPDLKVAEVIHLIEEGADPAGTPGFHEKTGYGRINFLRTLELAKKAASD